MAQDVLVTQLTMALSSQVENPAGLATGYNITPAGNFHKFVTTSRNFYFQSTEKFDDRGKIGLGTDLPNIRFSGYLNPPTLEIADNLDNFIHAMLIKRGCNTLNADVDTVPGSGAAAGTHTHSFKYAKTVSNPQSSTVIWSLDGAPHAWNGVAVSSWRAEGTRSDVPNFSASLVGSGRISDPSALVLNNYVTPRYMSGAETEVHCLVDRDGDGTPTQIYLASRAQGVQRITAWAVSVNNNVRVDDRRPGDPRISSGTPLRGHYVNRQTVGDRELAAELSIALSGDPLEQDGTGIDLFVSDSLEDRLFVDFTITCKGRQFIGTAPATTQPEITFVFPKCYLSTEEGVDDNNLAVLRCTIFPVYDDTEETALMVTVVNESAALV
jgi:hypothetical protein